MAQGENYGKGDGRYLRTKINEQSKIVEFWLTKDEKNDPDFQELLKPCYRQYRIQNYLVAVFLSGEEGLYQQTRDLLIYNQRKLAEAEAQASKLPGLAME